MQTFRVVACAIAALAGCAENERTGGVQTPEVSSSGLDPDVPLQLLDESQREQLCVWGVTELGGPGHSQFCEVCEGGGCIDWTVTVNTLEMCVAQLDELAACGASVADDEACVVAQAQDLCSSPSECDRFSDCL